ncbi:DUF6318 family protein [Sinomonas humi]|uniref:DUF6318 family protein n=1 Tax=Sinomonas humi TaxID=1338436 RepID=UPI0038B5A023
MAACGAPADAKGTRPPSEKATETTAASSPASTASPDPRPTPASSRGPARNVPPPVLPEAAKQNTAEGFEAFTQYWFDTVTYALETGDSEPLREISLPDCKMCNGYAHRSAQIAANSEWNVGPKWRISEFQGAPSPLPLRQARAVFLLDESSSAHYSSSGTNLESREPTSDGHLKAAYAVFGADQWIMAEVGNN